MHTTFFNLLLIAAAFAANPASHPVQGPGKASAVDPVTRELAAQNAVRIAALAAKHSTDKAVQRKTDTITCNGDAYVSGTISTDVGTSYSFTLAEDSIVITSICASSLDDGVAVSYMDDNEFIYPLYNGDYCEYGYGSRTFLTAGDYTATVIKAGDVASVDYEFYFECHPVLPDGTYTLNEATACGDSVDGDTGTLSEDYWLSSAYENVYPFTVDADSTQVVTIQGCSDDVIPFASIMSHNEDDTEVAAVLWTSELSDCSSAQYGTKLEGELSPGDYYVIVEGTEGYGLFTLDITCADPPADDDGTDSAASLSAVMAAVFSSVIALATVL